MMNNQIQNTPAVVLLSGGLDSATTLACAIRDGFECHALTFLYGQRHECEIESSKKVACAFGLSDRHHIIRLDHQLFTGSALTGTGPIPMGRDVTVSEEIPATYVPARNTVFLALALAYAEHIGSFDIFIGVNAIDFSGYPDCRPEFIAAFERLANLGTRAGVRGEKITIHAPLIQLTKVQIIQLGQKLGVDYSLTWSCYNPQGKGQACGVCDSCQIRRKAFETVGLRDPLPYTI
ncbi:MAG: 7-cyano-7-deazaguanine synthase QueC [Phycisphaerae bacterium]